MIACLNCFISTDVEKGKCIFPCISKHLSRLEGTDSIPFVLTKTCFNLLNVHSWILSFSWTSWEIKWKPSEVWDTNNLVAQQQNNYCKVLFGRHWKIVAGSQLIFSMSGNHCWTLMVPWAAQVTSHYVGRSSLSLCVTLSVISPVATHKPPPVTSPPPLITSAAGLKG